MKTKTILLTLICCTTPFFSSHAQSWRITDSLRVVYMEAQEYDSAIWYADKSLQTVMEAAGKNDTLYANMLNAKGDVYYHSYDYEKSLECLEKELEIRGRIQGVYSLEYSYVLEYMVEVNWILGNYSKAIPGCKEIIEIRKKILGKDHLYYATALTNLAILYNETGNNAEAEALLKEAVEIYKSVDPDGREDYANALNVLANLNVDQGNYSRAEPLFMQALEIDKLVFGEEDPIHLLNLANLYFYMGNYEKSEKLYIETSKSLLESYGERYPTYLLSQSNLANVYSDMGNIASVREIKAEYFSRAEEILTSTLLVSKEVIGENSPHFTFPLNNLANLYEDMGKSATDKKIATEYFAKALPLYEMALQINREVFGEKHLSYALALNNLGCLYADMGEFSASKEQALEKYRKAESVLWKSNKIYKVILGSKNADYANNLFNITRLYTDMSRVYSGSKSEEKYLKKAEPIFIEAIEVNNYNLKQNFTFLSEREKELYFNTQTGAFYAYTGFTMRRKESNPDLVEHLYNQVLVNKGLLLKSSTAMRLSVLNSGDSVLISEYNAWMNLKKTISDLNMQEVSERAENPVELEEKASKIEKQLVLKSQAFNEYEKIKALDWQDIKSLLQPEDVAIEFLRCRTSADSVWYAALLVRNNSRSPEMIRLFDEKELKKIIGENGANDFYYIQRLYGSDQSSGEQLYNLIWQPLEEYLTGIKNIYYSPDGLLHKISFSAISKERNLYLCDMYTLHQLSTTGKIVMPETFDFKDNLTAGIFGGIEFSTDSTIQKVWDYLPGTKTEGDNINRLMKTQRIQTIYLSGTNAEEKDFKEHSSNFDILHIATHGFFFPGQSQPAGEGENSGGEPEFRGGNRGFGIWQFLYNRNPLMRSGLVFAGANKVWNQPYISDEEDGVLTAQEISQLNMQRTQLVVLSACETGLGDIKGSEGVYGLQRAFKMAGVKYMIMSLWQIPDQETVEFMDTFYLKLLEEKDIRKAFSDTQVAMRKRYDPYFWAAFELIE